MHSFTANIKKNIYKELQSFKIFYGDNLDVGNPFASALHSTKLTSNQFSIVRS